MHATATKTDVTMGVTNEVMAKGAAPSHIELCCPRCNANLEELNCVQCGFQLRNIKGVIHALPPERVVYFARFIEEYERIRAAEGRGSESDEFYLGLPYSDASRRNLAQWAIRARSFDFLLERVLKPALPRGGTVLDLGAGNCWMSYRLALSDYRPCAVDLLTNERDGLGAAEHYRNYLPCFFPRFRAEFGRLPFRDEQFDAIVFNASFHYAEDFESAVKEALRCSRRGGMVIVSDTPWYSKEDSGEKMVNERRATFLRNYGTASASIESQEYLTDERLRSLESRLNIRWITYTPNLGFRWALRPLVAKLRNRREPARFGIYVARKAS
jgi:SAM-dependent methyltransferase